MLVLLQYILQQPDDSLMSRVYQAQIKFPTKGDRASETAKIITSLEIQLTNQEIKKMKINQFKTLVKKKTEIAAFTYLCKKQQRGKKGKYIKYEKLQMADYLLSESCASMKDKFDIFLLRVEMNDRPYNFGQKEFCKEGCQDMLTNKHILTCPLLNKSNCEHQHHQLLNGSVEEKIKVLNIFMKNLNELK